MDLVGARRLSPGRAHLRGAATAAAATAAAAAPQNRPPTVHGALRAVHGRGRQDLDGHGRRAGSGRRSRSTYRWSAPAGTFTEPVRRARRRGPRRRRKAPCRSPSRVDDGKGGTASDSVTIQVVTAGGEGVRLRGRALRLRPLHAAAGSDARARRGDPRAAGEPGPAHRRSKATPATSARPSTTSRSASAARTRSATT